MSAGSSTQLRRPIALDSWATHDWRNGLLVTSLAPLDRLLVRTCNHTYELIVTEPSRAEVLVRGGRFFPEFARARVAGSSLGGSFLKLHGIYVGFRLELNDGSRTVVTSLVRAIRRAADAANN